METSCHERVGLLAVVSVLLSMTFFIFGPIQLYIGNITELWFPITDMIGGCLLAGIIGIAVIFLFGLLLKGNFFHFYICLLFGLTLALYVQGNFVTTDYGVLNGQEIDWASYTFTAIWNTVLWIVCILLPFVLRILFKDKWQIGVLIVSSGIILVQLLTLGALCVITDFSANQRGEYYLSDKDLYSVSDKENVIIFILDTFDQDFFNAILTEDSDFLAPLDGFTYFQNMTGEYPTTRGALPYILTQQYYENEQPYMKYIDEAFANTDYYSELIKNGYDIALYTGDQFVSNDMKKAYCSNAEKNDVVVNSKIALEKEILRFTAFRYFPHIAKQYVWFYNGVFDDLKTVKQGNPVFGTTLGDNIKFYTGLKNNRLQCKSDSKVYHLIHLEGVHPPANLTEDVTVVQDGEGTYLAKARGALNIVYEYIRQLKELGIYDKTMIIVTADHGFYTGGSAIGNPLLLVKNFNSHGKWSISNVPVCHANLFATVMEEIGQNIDGKFGTSVYRIKPDDDIERRYLRYTWDDTWDAAYLPDMTEYKISSRGNKQTDYLYTGAVYTREGIVRKNFYEYRVGDTIHFATKEPGTKYFEFGLSWIDTDSAWTYGKSGRICLDFGMEQNELTGEFIFKGIYEPSQRLVIRCGDQVLYDEEVTTIDVPVTFSIPSGCVQDGSLILDLEYPDAVSPKSLGKSMDERELAFAFFSMRFYEQS